MESALSWTLWSWRDSGGSPFNLQPRTRCGKSTTSTLSTRQVEAGQRMKHTYGGRIHRITCLSLLSRFSSFRPRGLHYRGGEGAAGSGRSRAGALRCRRSAVSDHDCEQADEALQCALPHVHQQAGPHGSKPLSSTQAAQVSTI